LKQDDSLLRQRLLKEAIHELGHTLNLRHCQDYRCAMASSHSVEWVDLRDTRLCDACRYELESSGALR
jgi:archaemetzincin